VPWAESSRAGVRSSSAEAACSVGLRSATSGRRSVSSGASCSDTPGSLAVADSRSDSSGRVSWVTPGMRASVPCAVSRVPGSLARTARSWSRSAAVAGTHRQLVDDAAQVLLTAREGGHRRVQVRDQRVDRRAVGADAAQHLAEGGERGPRGADGLVEVLLVPVERLVQPVDQRAQVLARLRVERREDVGDLGGLGEVALHDAAAGDLGVAGRAVLHEQQALTDEGLPLHVEERPGVQRSQRVVDRDGHDGPVVLGVDPRDGPGLEAVDVDRCTFDEVRVAGREHRGDRVVPAPGDRDDDAGDGQRHHRDTRDACECTHRGQSIPSGPAESPARNWWTNGSWWWNASSAGP
jgi:hypothetical protein